MSVLLGGILVNGAELPKAESIFEDQVKADLAKMIESYDYSEAYQVAKAAAESSMPIE